MHVVVIVLELETDGGGKVVTCGDYYYYYFNKILDCFSVCARSMRCLPVCRIQVEYIIKAPETITKRNTLWQARFASLSSGKVTLTTIGFFSRRRRRRWRPPTFVLCFDGTQPDRNVYGSRWSKCSFANVRKVEAIHLHRIFCVTQFFLLCAPGRHRQKWRVTRTPLFRRLPSRELRSHRPDDAYGKQLLIRWLSPMNIMEIDNLSSASYNTCINTSVLCNNILPMQMQPCSGSPLVWELRPKPL